MSAESIDSLLASASTITLIVHGVGDHVEKGALRGVLAAHTAHLKESGSSPEPPPEDIDLSSLLPVGRHKKLTLSGKLIRLNGKAHAVCMVDWSHTRMRLLVARQSSDRHRYRIRRWSASMLSTAQALARTLVSLVLALIDICRLLLLRNRDVVRPWVRLGAVITLGLLLFSATCLLLGVVGYFAMRNPRDVPPVLS